MAITYNKDKRTGKTYAYETTYVWDPAKKQSRSKRTLIGRVDEETGKIVPTDGRCKKRSPNYVPEEDEYTMPTTVKELKAEVSKLREEIAVLKKKISQLSSKAKGKSDDAQ